MMWTPPSLLKIGHSVYTVEFRENLVDEDGVLLCGYCDDISQSIVIRAGLNEGRTVDTLLHEIIHAIANSYGWATVPQLSEEQVASFVAIGLSLVFSENPTLICYIQAMLTKGPQP